MKGDRPAWDGIAQGTRFAALWRRHSTITGKIMNRSIAIALCSLPLALASTVYAQGTQGLSGSGAAGAAQQAESTHPSGLAGGTGAKREPPRNESSAPAQDKPAEPAATTNPRSDSGTASNRSSSGSSTNTTVEQAPSETVKSAPSSKSKAPPQR